jgi:peptide/nickel transport system permease protein
LSLTETLETRPRRLAEEAGESAKARPAEGVVRRLLRSPKGAFGVAVLLVLAIVALFAPLLASYSPNEIHTGDQLAAPSAKYLFGTDEVGRDVLSRVMYSARPAIGAGVVTVALAAIVGAVTGLTAGYKAGAFDALMMRLWDTLLAFPAIFLAIGIVSVLGPGWINAILAIAILNMPVFSRLVRASTLAVRNRDFVTAAHAVGCSEWRIMLQHVFPNCVAPLVVQMAIAVPEAILIEASLSFLGLGSQPPEPSWGNMLGGAQAYLYRSAWYALFPGLAITIVVVGMSFFADGLQDALDPRRIRAKA